jgi:hypothetical protein
LPTLTVIRRSKVLGLFEPSRGIDAAYDEAYEIIERIEADLEDYKNEMCSDLLTPRSLAKSAWKYANTKPEYKDKYLIELPVTVAVPDDFIVKEKRGSGHKQVNKYRTAAVQELVDELERTLDVQKDRKAGVCNLSLPSLIRSARFGLQRLRRWLFLMHWALWHKLLPMRDSLVPRSLSAHQMAPLLYR